MRVFVDTNILIDLVCEREPFVEDARKLFAMGYTGQLQLVVSALSIVNTIYVGRKYGYTDIKEQLVRVAGFVEVADLKAMISIAALESKWSDYEDAVQCFTATNELSDCIVTRNKKDFLYSPIPVYDIKEFLISNTPQ